MKAKMFVLLVLTTTLPGCLSVALGEQSFQGTTPGWETNARLLSLEGHTRVVRRDTRLDASFFFTRSGFVEDAGIPAVGGGAYSTDNLSEVDFGMVARVYPLGLLAITPYVGGGGGYFKLLEGSRRYTGSCGWNCRTYVPEDDTIAGDVFWRLNAGILIPVTASGAVFIEFRRDGAKRDRGFVLDANQVMIGWRSGIVR